jgi:3-mercaptopyruvate sulfurtransferase SseA
MSTLHCHAQAVVDATKLAEAVGSAEKDVVDVRTKKRFLRIKAVKSLEEQPPKGTVARISIQVKLFSCKGTVARISIQVKLLRNMFGQKY